MENFKATLDIIGVNPFVFVPKEILSAIYIQAGKDKGTIPIHGTINSTPYKQTLVKFSGDWRLYINLKMLSNSTKRIGEILDITIEVDHSDRSIKIHPKLETALLENEDAKLVFDNLRPSKQLEIVRYIANLKSEESVDRNITRAIDFLLGNGRFVGRDKP
jgi:Bacteriocin-protection, YdeI or OmpD-Associated/Domain of unknown function (DUF1905)